MFKTSKKLKIILANAALVICSIVVTLILAETTLRFTPYKDVKRPVDFFEMKTRGYYIEDSELGFDIAKNFNGVHDTHEFKYDMFSNRYGCFDYDRKIPNDYILAIGDSFTWGYAPLDKKWTSYLEKKSGDFILKCGVASYGTKQELMKAKRVVKQVGKSPKYLMLMYYKNDMRDDFALTKGMHIYKINTSTGETNEFSEENLKRDKKEKVKENEKFIGVVKSDKPKKRSFWYKSILYNVYMVKVKPRLREFREGIKRKILYGNKMSGSWEEFATFRMEDYLHQKNELKWYDDIVNHHIENLQNFIRYAKEIKTTLLLVDISGTLDNDVFRDISTDRENVYYYNLKSDCPKPKKWNYDMHWNVDGNREVGECIYQHFKKIGLFK